MKKRKQPLLSKLSLKKLTRKKLLAGLIGLALIILGLFYTIHHTSTKTDPGIESTTGLQNQAVPDQIPPATPASTPSKSSPQPAAFRVESVHLQGTWDARQGTLAPCVDDPPQSFAGDGADRYDFMTVNSAGTVKYHWKVTDGSSYVYESPVYSLTFERAEQKNIPMPFSFRMIERGPNETQATTASTFDVIVDSPENSKSLKPEGSIVTAIYCPSDSNVRPDFFTP